MSNCFAQKLVLLAIVLIGSTVVVAQSGRRGNSKPTTPPPSTDTETKAPETKTDKAPHLRLLVGIDDPSAFDGIPLRATDLVLGGCVGRLNEVEGVQATVTSEKMTRSDAIKTAKGESQRYVVWLEVRNERSGAASSSSNPDDLYVNYVVFEPVTARIKTSGRARPQMISAGNTGIGLPPSSSGILYSDYAIKEAGRAAGDRILSAFEIRTGGWPRLGN